MTELYVLTRLDYVHYDENFAFVVRAAGPREARRIASQRAADEGAGAWLSVERSTCRHLKGDGAAGVILCDFKAG